MPSHLLLALRNLVAHEVRARESEAMLLAPLSFGKLLNNLLLFLVLGCIG